MERKTPRSAYVIPPAPAGFQADRYFNGPLWYQRWEVFDGIYTPGICNVADLLDRLDFPARLDGKRVLDIGAWNGCMSLECERRGAAEVVALSPEPARRTGFARLQRITGSRRVRFVRGGAYDLDPKRLGKFDIVLFCGVLYHLRYPLLAIDNIRRVCRGEVYIESYVWQPTITKAASRLPLWRFFRHAELAADYSNWFGPTAAAVREAFSVAGFGITQVNSFQDRASFRARPLKNGRRFHPWWQSSIGK